MRLAVARAGTLAVAFVCALGSCVLVQRIIEPPFPSFDAASFGSAALEVPASARVLLFSKTHGYRHDSIPAALNTLEHAAARAGLLAFSTESGAFATPETLECLSVVVFVSANGTILSAPQEAALRAWVEQGGSVLLLHGAVGDFDRASPWWWQLIGARFVGHSLLPNIVPLIVRVTPHAMTARMPAAFAVEDELYGFEDVQVPAHNVLLRAGSAPLAWVHDVGRGRVVVSALGHTDAVWQHEAVQLFVEDALAFLARPRW